MIVKIDYGAFEPMRLAVCKEIEVIVFGAFEPKRLAVFDVIKEIVFDAYEPMRLAFMKRSKRSFMAL